MSTNLIQAGALSGAMSGLMAVRSQNGSLPADYATYANIAGAIATEVLAANSALTAPMADADNVQLPTIVAQVTHAALVSRGLFSTAAGDYADLAAIIAAACKEIIASVPATPGSSFTFSIDLQAAPVTFAAVGAAAVVKQALTGLTGVIAGDVVYIYKADGLTTAGVVCSAGVGTGAGTADVPTANVTAAPYAGANEACNVLVIRPT